MLRENPKFVSKTYGLSNSPETSAIYIVSSRECPGSLHAFRIASPCGHVAVAATRPNQIASILERLRGSVVLAPETLPTISGQRLIQSCKLVATNVLLLTGVAGGQRRSRAIMFNHRLDWSVWPEPLTPQMQKFAAICITMNECLRQRIPL